MDSLIEAITDTEEHLFCTAMMKRLDIQRRNEQFCDVILEVGSGNDQARLKAHRIVLCAASPFFYNALNSEMKEKKEGVIRLEKMSKAVMEEVLDYLYTGHAEITKDNAYELFAQADYFLVPSLKALSSKFILQTLSLSNCIMSYYFAIKYQGQELLKGARDFILANFVDVARTEDFLNLSSKEIEEWISSDKIIVEEEEQVFQVIVKWMEKNGSKEDFDFLQLLRHVRCIYVSRNYVLNVILQHPLVNASVAGTEFILDAVKKVIDGTDECFFSQPPRDCLKTHEDVIVACGRKRTLCYVPTENTWYKLADMLSTHNPYQCAMSSLNNKLFIIGRRVDPSGEIAERYEPSLNLWVAVKVPGIVKNFISAVTLQGSLYVVGGKDSNNKRVSTVQKYNPDTNQWQEVFPLSSRRSNVCAVADGSYLYAIGGTSPNGEYLDIVERFDPRNNTWDKLPSTHAKRSSATGTAIRQKIFVFGGLSMPSTAGDPYEMYDPDFNMWIVFSSVFAPRRHASAVSFKGQIFIGGIFQNEHSPRGQEMSLRVYDVDKNMWNPCGMHLPLSDEFFKMSSLQISKDVLTKCTVVS